MWNNLSLISFGIGALSILSSCTQKPKTVTVPQKQEESETTSISATTSQHKKIVTLTFNEHVQPLLSEYCYHCHGPDSSSRAPEKEPLRLDREEFAFLKRKGDRQVIVKGKPEESELIRLIKSTDKSESMPPPEAHKTMKPHEIAILERWIKEGAEYQEHWSFIAPKKAILPKKQNPWISTPIDYFALNKMKENGLLPSSEQERSRLLRRVTFDLTGLPPTPARVQAFVTDKRPTKVALEEEVDLLLNTTEYAENFTRHWLDAARYADTHGIHIDNYRLIWPYRDWVLKAFQSNMPFNHFTIEQLAGDLFPKPTLDQKVATGFNRCLPTTGEGGAIAEEYDAIYAQDRVDTTAAVWLGLTTNCASCHDHKFDPISTKEVYQLTSFFRNTTMQAMDRNNAEHPPNIFVPTDTDHKRYFAINPEISTIQTKQTAYIKKNTEAFLKWKSQTASKADIAQVKGAFLQLPINSKATSIIDQTGKKYSITGNATWEPGIIGEAIKFTDKSSIDLGDVANFEFNKPFSFSAWIKADHKTQGSVLARLNTSNKLRGWDFWVGKGKVGTHIIHSWPDNALKTVTRKKLPKNKWTHVTVTYNGKSKANGVKIYLNGKSERLQASHNSLSKTIKSSTTLTLGKRSVGNHFTNGAVQDIKLFNRTLNQQEVTELASYAKIHKLTKTPINKISPKDLNTLKLHYFTSFNSGYKLLAAQLNKLSKEKASMEKRGSKTLVMQEKADTKPSARILIRGEYSNKGDEVFPGTPAVLHPMTDDQPKNRLGLAKWIVDKRNPLTARVTVNRYWYYFFGRGIVESTEDFGIMGARPTHPKLLDWLAVDFVENDWDIHKLIKNIVLSSTYCQSAIDNGNSRKTDPDNKLLARGPRYRLDAEQIRDLALSSSGLLARKMGGPSVRPYQPEGIWSAVAMKQSNTRNYVQDNGESLYRRSLYTFWKRTAPHPSMEILNAPSREVFCVRRELTNTPLQAFVVMNDTQFVEASRALAQQTLKNISDTKSRIDHITLQLLSRKLDTEEMKIALSSIEKASKHYKGKPKDAAKLIAVGASKADTTVNATELATWTLFTSQILNLDEALSK